MDRRSKIIVSVVGIFIVLLALVGITYAYFLTQVQGNTNETSISITTANLRLVYEDGQNIEAQNIQPGDTVYTKTFTVKNEGNAIIDYEVYLENIINNFVHEEDLLMFVTCSSNIAGNTCDGYGNGSVSGNTPAFGDSIYPQVNSLLIENSINPSSTGVDAEVHTYTLYLKFKDDGSDQSIDMGKTLQGKIQIYDPKDVVAITGTVTGYDSSYYLELHSDVKTSEIASDGSYIFYGVGAEEHTIYVKKRNSDGSTSDIGSSTIEVTKGNEASINSSASNMVINDDSYKATVNVTVPASKNSITLTGVSVKEYNPFNETSLAYQIYQNKAVVEEYELIIDYNEDCKNYALANGSTPEKYGCPIADKYNFKFSSKNNNIKELTTVTGRADGTNIEDNGLFKAEDDYGTSYIYRGSVINNYVDFAGFTWRIVRINGDGSVRLILDGALDKVKQRLENGTTASNYAGSPSAFNSNDKDNAYVGYTYGQIGVTAGNGTKTAYDLTHEYTGDKTNTSDKTGQSTIKQAVDTFYKTYLLDDYNSYISDTLFCGDKSLAKSGIGGVTTQLGYGTKKTYYAAAERLWYSSGTTSITEATPTLKCVANNTTLTEEQKAYSRYTVSGNSINGIKTNDDLIYPIALLSTDELVMSGAFRGTENLKYYLYNSSILSGRWWSMSPDCFGDFFVVGFYSHGSGFSLFNDYSISSNNFGIRPVINLSYTNTLWDEGAGTESDPYKVKLASTN